MRHILLACLALCIFSAASRSDSFSYLDPPCDPYYPHRDFPKLTTPQWFGESDVDAVVILSIDDMRDSAKYEAFLRPVLDRLKQIDGRAPVSIFTNSIDPADPQLQAWLAEGLSLETHTTDHPCPLLCDGDLAKAKSTFDRCLDQLCEVPGTKPVAFRMPCCDSLNTPSPRFWTEIFSKKTAGGNFLSIDSSVFNIFTSDDPDLPKEIVENEDGSARFRSYLPFPSFVNTIENYPYPYIVDGTCWEFPCVVPSDWEAQNIQQPNNPKTVEDWKRVLDATVIKKGVMPIVFHPHGWIRSEQLVNFVEYADKTYGKRVRFITFAEALSRINEHLLGGVALRENDGNQWSIRLIDVNQDGFMDVVRNHTGTEAATHIWDVQKQQFDVRRQITEKTQDTRFLAPTFGTKDGVVHYIDGGLATKRGLTAFRFDAQEAVTLDTELHNGAWRGAGLNFSSIFKIDSRPDFRFRDIDNDGTSELFVTTESETLVLDWLDSGFVNLPFKLPVHLGYKNASKDNGVRLVDLNNDKCNDVVVSIGDKREVWLFKDKTTGWQKVDSGEPELAKSFPAIAGPDGTNNGAWFHTNHLWVQNENTARLPDLVDRVSYEQLVGETTNTTTSQETTADFGTAKSLTESLETFSLLKNTRLEVVAAEPQIADPVAFDWGPNGELWVVEMGDYPNGANWHGPGDKKGDAGGRVKLLLDKDGDGRYETAHLFMDGLTVPTGVKAYRDGILITAAPHIIYAIDTNGDHRADKRKILFSGLEQGNQQHRMNGLRWGLDHWLHVGNGESGGSVKSEKTGDQKDIRGRDFKIQPDTGQVELTSGQSQYGRNRDNLGNWFGGNNSEPVWHYVLNPKYQARNEFISSPPSRRIISKEPGAAPVFPTSQTIARFNDYDRADRFTSACSTEPSRNDDEQRSFVYICEPVHNLVHRSVLTREGTSFSSARAEEERETEFLASSDNWFRPVMARSGPDGAMWVVDMYRQVIEHPEWIPMEWQKQLDHLSGNDKGRIYRIVFDESKNETDKKAWTRIRSLSDEQLVKQLDTPNGVLRDMLQQELYTRSPKSAITPLQELHARVKWKSARIPIAYLLNHLDGLDESFLSQALTHNQVDPHLLKAALPQLKQSQALRDKFFAWLDKTELSVDQQVQIAYLLGDLDDARSAKALVNLAVDSAADPYRRAAVMSSLTQKNISPVTRGFLLPSVAASTEPPLVIVDLIPTAVGLRDKDSLHHIVKFVDALDDVGDRLGHLGQIVAALQDQRVNATEVLDQATLNVLHAATADAAKTATDESLSESIRVQALSVFNFHPAQKPVELSVLNDLLGPQHPPSLQTAAVKLLRRMGDSKTAASLFSRWRSLSPAVRSTAIEASFAETAWTDELLSGMERGDISARQIEIQQQRRLRDHKNEAVRTRAAKLLEEVPSDREAVFQRYTQETANHEVDAARGKDVFAKQCSACHLLEGQGRAVGPNLVALSDKSKPAMLAAILDPNRAVEEKYLDYTVVLKSGEVLQGLLEEESATGITLATAKGERKDVLRNQIEVLQATGKSLMPEGLEQVVKPQDMSDLIHYVQSVRANRKRFEGNNPQLAPVRDDHSIRMFAMHAEIYGPDLVFESKYRNLGFWKTDQDRAVWTIHAKKAGRYEFNLDYACAAQTSNNRFQLRVNGEKISGQIKPTGSWDNYESKNIATIWLPAEPVQVTLTSEGPVDGFLFDLRTIVLWPEE